MLLSVRLYDRTLASTQRSKWGTSNRQQCSLPRKEGYRARYQGSRRGVLTAEGTAATVCRWLVSPACVRACVRKNERVCRVWKRQQLSRLSRATRRDVAPAAAMRESVSSARQRSSGGWPPLAWIPWRVVHLRVKVLARGMHACTNARMRASARLVSPSGGARSRVYASTVCTFALQIATRERRVWTLRARMHGATTEKCGQSTSYRRCHAFTIEDTVVLQFRYPSRNSRPPLYGYMNMNYEIIMKDILL